MSTFGWVLIIVLIGLYVVAWFVLTEKFYRKWEAEYTEIKTRKDQIMEKRGPQPDLCPYCGELVPSNPSGIANCPRCGRLVVANP